MVVTNPNRDQPVLHEIGTAARARRRTVGQRPTRRRAARYRLRRTSEAGGRARRARRLPACRNAWRVYRARRERARRARRLSRNALLLPIGVLMTSLLVLLVVVGTTIWIGTDASKRDWSDDSFANSTTKWVIGSVLLWIVVFPVYLARRNRVPLKDAGRDTAARASAAIIPAAPAAGWYTDPQDTSMLRYWTGLAWSTHTAKPAG